MSDITASTSNKEKKKLNIFNFKKTKKESTKGLDTSKALYDSERMKKIIAGDTFARLKKPTNDNSKQNIVKKKSSHHVSPSIGSLEKQQKQQPSKIPTSDLDVLDNKNSDIDFSVV